MCPNDIPMYILGMIAGGFLGYAFGKQSVVNLISKLKK